MGDRPCGCPGPLRLRRVRERQVVSLRHGRIVAVEQTGFCPVHPTRSAVRSAELARLLPVGGNHAYDLMVRIGIAHFLECRQQAEVRADLASRFALDVPLRTIGHLARKFVAYVQVVHRESVPSLKTDMIRRGGYVLHVDGTCEEGSRVLLVCMDSVSGQVLDSRKIGSEGKAEVQAVLEGVRAEWGVPLAAVHDLGQVLFPAVAEVFPGVPQFVCHYHLAADVGKDVLGPGVDHLRKLFREVKLRPKLGVVVRSLRPFAVDSGGAHVLASLLDGPDRKEEEAALPEATALGMIHGLVSWILAFSRTGNGYGFPFDVPWLELYERVVAAHTLLAGVRATGQPGGDRVAGDLDRVRRILATVVQGERASEFARVAAGLRRDRKVFETLRERLRICPRDGKRRRNDEGLPATVDPVQHRIILDNFRVTLRQRMKCEHGPVRACRIVLEHLDKYWPYLFGHRLEGTHGIVAPRTNNLAEQEFRKVKQGCRRLHGRGHLKRDVDEMPAGAVLLQNLKRPAYRRRVYGGHGENEMAARFSRVDPTHVAKVMRGWKEDRSTSRLPRILERAKNLTTRLVGVVKAALRAPQKPA